MTDWIEQWDDCDVCECCEQLTNTSLIDRMDLAITLLYMNGVLTEAERNKTRKRLNKLKQKDKTL